MQNFAAHIVLALRKFDHISQGIRSLNWLIVKERLFFNDAVMVFKCVNNLVPGYLFTNLSHVLVFIVGTQVHVIFCTSFNVACLLVSVHLPTVDGSTKRRNPESGNGITETEKETETQSRKRKQNTESVKEGSKRSIWKNIYISNDNKINKEIKKRHKWIN